VLIYAWNPLVVWELAGNAHIDAAAIGFAALALLARARGRAALSGAALGAAIAVKFLPAVLFPALWRRWDWRMPATTVVLIVALYLIYIGAGWQVLGFLPGYATEEGIEKGNGIFWLDAIGRFIALPGYAGQVWMALVVLALAGLAVWMMLLRQTLPAGRGDIVAVARDAGILASAAMIADAALSLVFRVARFAMLPGAVSERDLAVGGGIFAEP
jgi:hypothetical protein